MLRNPRSRGRRVVVEGRKSWREEYLLRISGFLPQLAFFSLFPCQGQCLSWKSTQAPPRSLAYLLSGQEVPIKDDSRPFEILPRSFTPHGTHRAPEGCASVQRRHVPLQK